MFCPGDKVYNILINKFGTVVNLRNDSREKKMREQDPSHYYYHIDYEDGSFDTYVSVNSLIEYDKQKNYPNIQTQSEFQVYYNYERGQRFVNTETNKTGTIRYLRNDEYEKNQRKSEPTHYYYHVDYDDGSFETYEYGGYLKPI